MGTKPFDPWAAKTPEEKIAAKLVPYPPSNDLGVYMETEERVVLRAAISSAIEAARAAGREEGAEEMRERAACAAAATPVAHLLRFASYDDGERTLYEAAKAIRALAVRP